MVHVARDHSTAAPRRSRIRACRQYAGWSTGTHGSRRATGGRSSRPAPGRLRAMLGPVWRDRRIAVGVAVLAAGVYGLVAAWWTPRGPITTPEAVAAIAIGLAVGAVAGVAMRSRWAMLLAPVTFVAVFELARIGTVGPMVDGIPLGSLYGFVAFALGRGLHGVLAVVPMLLGATLGAAAARRLDGDGPDRHGWARAGLWTRRTGTALRAWGCWS